MVNCSNNNLLFPFNCMCINYFFHMTQISRNEGVKGMQTHFDVQETKQSASEDFAYSYPVSFSELQMERTRMIFCSPQADNMTLVFCYCSAHIFGSTMLLVQWQTPIFWPLCKGSSFIKPCNIYNYGGSMQVCCSLIYTFVSYKFKTTGMQFGHHIEILNSF